jgi:4-oxalocrotonate tautomerase
VPFVRVDMKDGRSPDQVRDLHRRLADVISEVLEVPVTQVRTYITQFPASAWGIGGVPADPIDQLIDNA